MQALSNANGGSRVRSETYTRGGKYVVFILRFGRWVGGGGVIG